MTIVILATDAKIPGELVAKEDPKLLVPIVTPGDDMSQLLMVKLKSMELIIVSKLPILALELSLMPTIQILLILSVLLAGNCLTVARVGIIMISLNHGGIFSQHIASVLI